MRYILILLLGVCISCASRKTIEVTEMYPSKALKTQQRVTTYKVCRENCRIVKTKKERKEYFENGKLMSIEKSQTETTLDGQLTTFKNFSKFYDEKGKLVKKINKDDYASRTYIYQAGKLIAKTSFDN